MFVFFVLQRGPPLKMKPQHSSRSPSPTPTTIHHTITIISSSSSSSSSSITGIFRIFTRVMCTRWHAGRHAPPPNPLPPPPPTATAISRQAFPSSLQQLLSPSEMSSAKGVGFGSKGKVSGDSLPSPERDEMYSHPPARAPSPRHSCARYVTSIPSSLEDEQRERDDDLRNSQVPN